jgi:hypothetical protein
MKNVAILDGEVRRRRCCLRNRSPAIPCPEAVSGSSSPATPVARHGGRAPNTLVFANTRVDDRILCPINAILCSFTGRRNARLAGYAGSRDARRAMISRGAAYEPAYGVLSARIWDACIFPRVHRAGGMELHSEPT